MTPHSQHLRGLDSSQDVCPVSGSNTADGHALCTLYSRPAICRRRMLNSHVSCRNVPISTYTAREGSTSTQPPLTNCNNPPPTPHLLRKRMVLCEARQQLHHSVQRGARVRPSQLLPLPRLGGRSSCCNCGRAAAALRFGGKGRQVSGGPGGTPAADKGEEGRGRGQLI